MTSVMTERLRTVFPAAGCGSAAAGVGAVAAAGGEARGALEEEAARRRGMGVLLSLWALGALGANLAWGVSNSGKLLAQKSKLNSDRALVVREPEQNVGNTLLPPMRSSETFRPLESLGGRRPAPLEVGVRESGSMPGMSLIASG